MCVHFPFWSLQRNRHQRPELRGKPLAIMRPVLNKGGKVLVCCAEARRQGIRPGMMQVEALAMAPTLACVEEDLDADRQVLTELAGWSQQFSPVVGIEEGMALTSLLIDTTGCAACFGGEEKLIEKACGEFSGNGWTVIIALADTIGAAWGISHFPLQVSSNLAVRGTCGSSFFVWIPPDGSQRVSDENSSPVLGENVTQEVPLSPVLGGEGSGVRGQYQGKHHPLTPDPSPPSTGEREASWKCSHQNVGQMEASARCVLDLPVAALRLSERNLGLLKQLGIEQIHQLAVLPRDQVAERFGVEIRMRLDQALGQAAEVITPFHALPDAVAGWMFEDPVERREILAQVLDLLLERLQAILEKRCCGTRLLECTFEQEGMDAHVFECSLSRPARAAAYLRPLLKVRLEQQRLQAPVIAICLRALVLERMPDEQRELFDAEGADNEKTLAHFLDSLVSRLGRDAVTKARFVADPQPEKTCSFECALEDGSGDAESVELPIFRHRPVRIFPRPIPIEVTALVPLGIPQRFHHAGTNYTAIHCQGPERIETGWWRAADIHRDYYMVETTEGTRWWLFRRMDDGHWFLHGCFD